MKLVSRFISRLIADKFTGTNSATSRFGCDNGVALVPTVMDDGAQRDKQREHQQIQSSEPPWFVPVIKQLFRLKYTVFCDIVQFSSPDFKYYTMFIGISKKKTFAINDIIYASGKGWCDRISALQKKFLIAIHKQKSPYRAIKDFHWFYSWCVNSSHFFILKIRE